MPKPDEWKGSNLRSRAEVVQWLHDHGNEVHDPTGLIVGRMRNDLGMGRALSQLLADMEADGMIRREVRGRRTLSIKLLDDWDLKHDLRARRAPAADGNGSAPVVDGEVDLEQLATTLLAIVIKRAKPEPSKGAELERLREKATKQADEIKELRDHLILARESEAEQRRQADTMRESLAKLQRTMDKPKRTGTPLVERLDAGEKRLLKQLMESLPSGRG